MSTIIENKSLETSFIEEQIESCKKSIEKLINEESKLDPDIQEEQLKYFTDILEMLYTKLIKSKTCYNYQDESKNSHSESMENKVFYKNSEAIQWKSNDFYKNSQSEFNGN